MAATPHNVFSPVGYRAQLFCSAFVKIVECQKFKHTIFQTDLTCEWGRNMHAEYEYLQ